MAALWVHLKENTQVLNIHMSTKYIFLIFSRHNRLKVFHNRLSLRLLTVFDQRSIIINEWINKYIISNNLEVAHPQSASSSTWFLVEFEFENVGFWREGKTGVPGEKPLGAKEKTNNKLNSRMAWTPGFEPGPHWWEANALTTAPSLAPIRIANHYHFPPLNGYSSFSAADAANKHHPPLFTLPSTDQSSQYLSYKHSHLPLLLV